MVSNAAVAKTVLPKKMTAASIIKTDAADSQKLFMLT
jgi:hypothetical protein